MKTKVNYLNTSLDVQWNPALRVYLFCIRGLCEIFPNKLRDVLMFAPIISLSKVLYHYVGVRYCV